ncbi:MAG: hypothetical protein HZB57_03375 [Gammaproteobacteria bacterium]|nr:hypothetical protein [Gammaproteobacteria bacterium]
MNIKHALAALALGQMVMVGQASAACVAGDIAGTWYTHLAFWNSVDGGGSEGWQRCKAVVNSSGGISTATSQCNDELGRAYTISAGTLRVTTACLVTGSLTVKRNGVVHGRAVVSYAQMDKNHANFSGLGYVSTEPDVKFSIQAVKQ